MLAVSPLTSFQPSVLGAELVRLRTDVHLTQRGLAKLSKVSHTQISEIEAGNAPAPHPTLLMKLAIGLATSGSGLVDLGRSEGRYLDLMRAAGYLPEPPEPDENDDVMLRRLIAKRVGDNAPLAEAMLVRLQGVTSINQDAVLGILDVIIKHQPFDESPQ